MKNKINIATYPYYYSSSFIRNSHSQFKITTHIYKNTMKY